MNEVTTAAAEFDNHPEIGAIIITGSPKAFAAGADITEMADLSSPTPSVKTTSPRGPSWPRSGTPTVAAVAGYALGGGCELAMMGDLLIVADSATFDQPRDQARCRFSSELSWSGALSSGSPS
jgi:enoyl-CoA hydratase